MAPLDFVLFPMLALGCFLTETGWWAPQSAVFIQLLGLLVDAGGGGAGSLASGAAGGGGGGWSSALWLLALAAAGSAVLTPYFVIQLTKDDTGLIEAEARARADASGSEDEGTEQSGLLQRAV